MMETRKHKQMKSDGQGLTLCGGERDRDKTQLRALADGQTRWWQQGVTLRKTNVAGRRGASREAGVKGDRRG